MEYEKLERIYEQVLSLKFKDLDKMIDKAKTEDEKEFYLDLYNYKLARNQDSLMDTSYERRRNL